MPQLTSDDDDNINNHSNNIELNNISNKGSNNNNQQRINIPDLDLNLTTLSISSCDNNHINSTNRNNNKNPLNNDHSFRNKNFFENSQLVLKPSEQLQQKHQQNNNNNNRNYVNPLATCFNNNKQIIDSGVYTVTNNSGTYNNVNIRVNNQNDFKPANVSDY